MGLEVNQEKNLPRSQVNATQVSVLSMARNGGQVYFKQKNRDHNETSLKLLGIFKAYFLYLSASKTVFFKDKCQIKEDVSA